MIPIQLVKHGHEFFVNIDEAQHRLLWTKKVALFSALFQYLDSLAKTCGIASAGLHRNDRT